MENRSKWTSETLAAQGGPEWADERTRSVVPPLYPSTTFLRNPDLTYHEGRKYARADNPTFDPASSLLTELEHGQRTQLFASGMAATGALLTALSPGDHLVLSAGAYGGTRGYLDRVAARWGLGFSQLTENTPRQLTEALIPGRTKVVWIETPSNPLWTITDIAAFSEMAHQRGATVVVDNTVPTPVLTRPFEHGADIVMHSATKYLNGHGDVLLGALVTKTENPLWSRIVELAHDAGAIPGTFEAWLLLRGMRTLFLRMERICANAQRIAEFLAGHAKIAKVHYPGLPDSPGHEIAKKQMNGGFGGMISIQVHGFQAAVTLQAHTRLFKRATSLGTTESLIEHRQSYEGPESAVPRDLLRLSIGIESADDLIEDLTLALSRI